MTRFAALLISVAAVAILTVLGVYLLAQIFRNFQPGRRKVDADIKGMREELQPYISELVPWDDKEIELLSLNQINRTNSHRITRKAKGVFTSVFHEPMIAWSYRSYLGTGENAAYYVRTSQHDLEYWQKGKDTFVRVDGKDLGTIRQDGALLDSRKKKVLAFLDTSKASNLLPVVVGDRELGKLVTKSDSATPNPRAFELLKPMNQEDEKAFLAVSLWQMVRREVQSKK